MCFLHCHLSVSRVIGYFCLAEHGNVVQSFLLFIKVCKKLPNTQKESTTIQRGTNFHCKLLKLLSTHITFVANDTLMGSRLCLICLQLSNGQPKPDVYVSARTNGEKQLSNLDTNLGETSTALQGPSVIKHLSQVVQSGKPTFRVFTLAMRSQALGIML